MNKFQLENALTTIKSVENLMHLFEYDNDTQQVIKKLIEQHLAVLKIKLDIEERSHINTFCVHQQIDCLIKVLEILDRVK
jgi:hypothetical protein